jgi:hypothetical protein
MTGNDPRRPFRCDFYEIVRLKESTREKLAYVSHGLVGLMCWLYIAASLMATEQGKIVLPLLMFAALVTIVPVVLIVVAFVTGFYFKPTRILSLLMPLMIYGTSGYEDVYALLMVPYAVLSVGVFIWWANQRSSLPKT